MLPLIITDLIHHPADRRMDRPEVTTVTLRRMDLPEDLRDHMDLTMLLLLVRRPLHLERPAGLQLPMADLLHIQECRQVDTHPILATEDTHHPHIADPMATLAIIHPLPILHPKDGPAHPVMVAHPPTVVHPQETTGKATMVPAQATHHRQAHLRVRPHLHLQHRRVPLVHL